MYYREKKVIFVHVPKTAGQSVEHFFLRDAGLSWEDRAAFVMGPNEDPSKGPIRLAHLLARDYVGCGHLSQREFDESFKFAFVRHPLARALSTYKYERAFLRMSFFEYVNVFLRDTLAGDDTWFHRPQVDFVNGADGDPLVDFVGRFENLQGDFAKVCETLGMPVEDLPPVNVSLVSDHGKTRMKNLHDGFRNRVRVVKRRLRGQPIPVVHPVPSFEQAAAHAPTMQALRALYGADFEQFGYDGA